MLGNFFGQAGQYRVLESRTDEFMVDFIRYYQHIIGQADFRQPQKLLPVPNPANWIVRAAQDEQLDIFTITD